MSLVVAPYTDSPYNSYPWTPVEEIVELYHNRLSAQSPDIARMRLIQSVLNDEMAIPLPELQEDERASTANLILQGNQQLGRRIASVQANMYFPSSDPADPDLTRLAHDKQRVMTGWHKDNRQNILAYKRAKQFLAYASAPVIIKPSPRHAKEQIPRWMVRNPLNTLPAECDFSDCRPLDCIFLQYHSLRWLMSVFPEQTSLIFKGVAYDPENPDLDQLYTCIEYVSPTECSLILLGQDSNNTMYDAGTQTPESMGQPLYRAANLTDECLAVIPGSISVDKQRGHFDSIIGIYEAQAALMALSLVAQRRAVWPREWAVSLPNETVDVVSIPDPYTGTPGEITGGKIETQKLDPSLQSLQLQDLLSEAQRMTAGLPSEFGGLSPTNVRTGARGKQIISSTIDFTIAEAQDIFAASLYEENKLAIAIDKMYYPGKKTYYIATRSFNGRVEYTPSELWDTDKHVVDYPIAGVDLANLPIEGGQRVQMQTMSRKRFMEIDPAIPDAEQEWKQITREAILTAFISQIQTLASTPEGPFQPIDLAHLDRYVAEDMDLYEAVERLQKEAQKRQAEAAPTPAAEQPGLSLPGQGVEQPPATPQDQPPNMQEFTQLLNQLGTQQTAMRYRG